MRACLNSLIVIEDQEYAKYFFRLIYHEPAFIEYAIIHIGTKDECQPNILDQSLSLSSRLGLNQCIFLLPSPIMISFGVSKFALIFHQYDVQLYNNPYRV